MNKNFKKIMIRDSLVVLGVVIIGITASIFVGAFKAIKFSIVLLFAYWIIRIIIWGGVVYLRHKFKKEIEELALSGASIVLFILGIIIGVAFMYKMNNDLKDENDFMLMKGAVVKYLEIQTLRSRQDKVDLIALKHNIDRKVCKEIIDEYLGKIDLSDLPEIMHQLFIVEEKEGNEQLQDLKYPVKKLIDDLSKKHKIDKQIIAKVIFDYKIASYTDETVTELMKKEQ